MVSLNRCRVILFSACAVTLWAATPPDFSGKWILDPSRSPDSNGVAIELNIQEPAGKLIYDRILRERNGKKIHTSFTCASIGTSCDLTENGHKGSVSLWYDGAALMMAKSGGESRDASTERRFELSPDGKTLTVEFTNYSGSGKPEKLVFTKE